MLLCVQVRKEVFEQCRARASWRISRGNGVTSLPPGHQVHEVQGECTYIRIGSSTVMYVKSVRAHACIHKGQDMG